MGVLLLSVFGLVFIGGRGIGKPAAGQSVPASGVWPAVAIIVPASGFSVRLPECLRSILKQDYPSFKVIFITRDIEDPATPIIEKTIPQCSNAELILSGEAVSCGQKNHSILAGIQALDDQVRILVFCDSTRIAPSGWLKDLVGPIITGEASVTSGYHHAIPEDDSIAATGHAWSVLGLCMTRGIRFLIQPWGGSTAIRRDTFQKLKVEQLWAQNVVDDVSLAAHLKKNGTKVISRPGKYFTTPIVGETVGGWYRWIVRQWLYLKFCQPVSWFGAGLFCYYMSGMVILTGVLCLGGLLAWVPPIYAGYAFLFQLIFITVAGALRFYHPRPGPLFKWIMAAYVTLMMAFWAHLTTLFSTEIHWKGIRYRVAWKGYVKEIIKTG